MKTKFSLLQKNVRVNRYAVALFALVLIIFFSFASSAGEVLPFMLGEKISVELASGSYKVEIVTPSQTNVLKVSGSFFVVPSEVGSYKVRISGDEKRTLEFDVVTPDYLKSLSEQKHVITDVDELSKQEIEDVTSIPVESLKTVVDEVLIDETVPAVDDSVSRVFVGSPVRWRKVMADSSISIPVDASNISVMRNGSLVSFEEERSLTAAVLSVFSSVDEKSIVVNGSGEGLVIEFVTPAPVSQEVVLSDYRKEVRIISNTHYTNVVASTSLRESLPLSFADKIKVYWVEEDRFLPFMPLDNDSDGLIDGVVWEIDHLSNQTFQIILISKAELLDASREYIADVYVNVSKKDGVFQSVSSGEFVRVTFERNLTDKNDITIFAKSKNGTPVTMEVYEKDDSTVLAKFEGVSSASFYKIFLTSLVGIQDVFDIKALGDILIDFILDPNYGIHFTGLEADDTAPWDGWIDGGGDCIMSTTLSAVDDAGAAGGTDSIEVQDNSASSYTAQTFDLSAPCGGEACEYINFSIYLRPSSYDNTNEGFDIWCDYGTGSAVEIGTWVEDGDGCVDMEGIEVCEDAWTQVTFNLTAEGCTIDNAVEIRVTSDDFTSGGNGDQVYIDGMNITGYRNAPPTQSTPLLNSSDGANSTSANLTVHIQSAVDLDNDPIIEIIRWNLNGSTFEELLLPFEGGSNSTFTREYANDNNGSVIGATHTATGGYNNTGGYIFDSASSEYINFSTDLGTILGSTSSLAFWIQTTQTGSNTAWLAPGITGVEEAGGGDDIFWGWIGASGDMRMQKGNTAGSQSTAPINNGDWHHIVMTWHQTSGVTNLYVNGVLNDTGTTETGAVGNSFYRIGSIEDTGGTPTYFNGTLDEVRAYDRVLSAEQVKALYLNRTDLIVSQETNLSDTWQACVTLNDGFSDGTQDCSNNLTVVEILSPPLITFNTLTNGSSTADVTPILNVSLNDTAQALWYSLNGAANITICTVCNESQTVFLYVNESIHTVEVFANNTLGAESSNESNFTIDMNFSYYDDYNDSYQIDSSSGVTLNVGNITYEGNAVTSVETYSTVLTGTTDFILLNNQNGSRAVPFVTLSRSGNDINENLQPRVDLNDTHISVERVNSDGQLTLIINVVEFNPNKVRVQTGTYSFAGASSVQTISTAVNTSRTALIFYHETTDTSDDFDDMSVMGEIVNTTSIVLTRDATTGTISGRWYVFESLDGSFTVQNVTLGVTGTSTSDFETITSVALNKTFLVSSFMASIGQDDSLDAAPSVVLTNSTAISMSRSNGGTPDSSSVDVVVYAVTFSDSTFVQRGNLSYTAATATDSDILSSVVNLDASFVKSTLRLGRMESNSAGGGNKEGSVQRINLTTTTFVNGTREETTGATVGFYEVVDFVHVGGNGLFTARAINTSSPVSRILNTSWSESGTDADNNITLHVSPDGGSTWYNASNNGELGNVVSGSELMYKVFFNSSNFGSPALLNLNITWSNTALPPPNITIHSPANGTTIADVTPTLNVTLTSQADAVWYSLDGGASNTTFCEDCSGNQYVFLPLAEGGYNVTVYANDTTGSENSNFTNFTVDMNYNYFDTYLDNSSLLNQILYSGTWQPGNITMQGTVPERINFSAWESGEQNWVDGGADSDRSSVTSLCQDDGSLGGSFSWHLQDDTTTSYTENNFSFVGYDEVVVNWSAFYTSIEGTEYLSFQCDGTEVWTYQANTQGTEDVWLNGSANDQEVTISPSDCTFDSEVTLRFEAEFSGNGDEVYIDCFEVTGQSAEGNFTAYPINTTSTIVEIVNVTWNEAGTDQDNNLTIEVSADFGQNWYTATSGEGILGIATGTSLLYRASVRTNESTNNVSLLDMNITWSDQASPPPNITIISPLNGSAVADVTPTLNVSLDGAASTLWYTTDGGATNNTICTDCSGYQYAFLPLAEGGYTVTVYTSNVLGTKNSNLTNFTVDMNYTYYNDYNDNSSLVFGEINNVSWLFGNVTFTTFASTSLLNETFEDADNWALTGGTWTITGEQLHQTANADSTTAIQNFTNMSAGRNYNVSMDAYDDDNDDTGVIFRYMDSSNYYRCRYNLQTGSNALERIDGGSTNTLDTTASTYTTNAVNTYFVSIIDNNITCYINGQAVMTAIDSTWETGQVGIFNSFHDEALYDNFTAEELLSTSHGNFTAYTINTSTTAVEITNVTWNESGTDATNNISVQLSLDNGGNWYNATKNSGISGMSAGDQIVYRVLFNTNTSGNISLLDMNFTWSDQASPAPNITIHSPVNNSTFPDVTPTLNFTLSGIADAVWGTSDGGATNSTFCTQCSGNQYVFLPLAEGQYNLTLYSNNSLGEINSNATSFTIDMDRNYYDTYDDNSSLLNQVLYKAVWQAGNISFTGVADTVNYSAWESGEQGWTDGGADSDRSSVTSLCQDDGSLGGSFSWHLQDNSGTSYTEQAFDFTGYDKVKVNWSAFYTSIENTEYLRLLCDGTELWTYEANTLGTEDVWLNGSADGQEVIIYPANCTFDSSVTVRFESEFSGDGDDVYLDCFEAVGQNVSGNFTAYPINTTQPIKNIVNITWNEDGTTASDNITVEVSADYGSNWYNTTNGLGVSGIAEGSSLLYRVLFNSNTTTTISLLDMNITWSSPPTVTIFYPVNTTYTANTTRINYTAVPGAGVSLDTCWYTLDGGATNTTVSCTANVTGISSFEGSNNWTVYANDTEGAIGQDTVFFTVDTGAPILQFINQTDDNERLVNDSHPLEEGQNLTIRVNATDSNLDRVWVVVWQSVKGGLQQAKVFFTYMAGLGLWVADVATDFSWGLAYNYTIYANDTSNQTSEIDGNFTILKLNSTISLHPNPTDGTGNFTINGSLQFTNGTYLANHPINLWLDGELLLLSNFTPIGVYDNYPNVTDTSSAEFNLGTYNQTTTDGENVTLFGQNVTGNFTRIIDAGARVEWNAVSWQHTGQACSALLEWQEGVNGFAGTIDTYVDGDNANTNYGSSSDLYADTNPTQRAAISFDVVGPGGNKIPYNSTVTNANITVTVYDTGNPVNVYEILEEWAESEATYNHRLTGGTSWGSTGIAGPPSRSSTLEDSFSPSATGNYTFDITNAMRRWVNQTSSNYGVVLSPGGTNNNIMRSSEYSVATQRPRLQAKFNASDCTSVIMYVRFSDDKLTWSSWQETSSGAQLSDPNTASRYLQYRAVLGTVNSSITPYLNEVVTNYTAVVTNATGQYRYNLSSPSAFGTYDVVINSSIRTIFTNNSATLSVQSGVPPAVKLVLPNTTSWFNYSEHNLTYNATDANNNLFNASLFLNTVYNQSNTSIILNGGHSNFTVNLSSGQYNWSVNVTDSTSNEANSSTWTFYVDLENPVVNLMWPPNNSVHTVNELNLSFNVTDNMDSSLTCDVTLDGSIIHSGVAAANATQVNRTSGTMTDGIHLWNVTCRDESFRNNISVTRWINISDTPPNVTLIWPSNDYIDSDDGNISFVYYPVDNSGFTNCSLYVDGAYTASNASAVFDSENNTINGTNIPEGFHNWTVECVDLSLSTHQPPVRNFTVDLTAPNLVLNAPSNASTASKSDLDFNFTITDAIDDSLSCNLTVENTVVSSFAAANGSLTNQLVENLTDGLKYWNVTCVDDAGHTNSSLTWEVTIAEYPTIVLNTANETSFSTSSPTLFYTPSDNTNFSTCDLYINGVFNQSNSSQIQNGQQNNFEVNDLSDGTYTWFVNCSDVAGLRNVSQTRTFYVDAAPPQISMHYPLGDSIFADNVTFNFTVTDAIDAAPFCNLTVDSTIVAQNFTVTNATLESREIESIADGYHTWHVNCSDSAGNVNGSSIENFTKITAPDVRLIAPADGYWSNVSTFNVTYFPDDDEGFIASYLVLNGTVNLSNATPVIGAANNNFTVTLPDAVYNWTVIVTDVSGTNGTNATRLLYVDSTPPNVTLNNPLDDELVSTNNVTFNFTPFDNLDNNLLCNLTLDGSVEYSDTVANDTDQVVYLLVVDGVHLWNVTCIDEAGHVTVSQTRNFTVEAPPNVTLLNPANGTKSNESSWVFNYTPEDPIGINSCSIYLDGVLNQTDNSITANEPNNFTITGVSEGLHNWTVNCTDPDLNTFQAEEWIFYRDTTPPNVILNAPLNASGVDANNANVIFNWTATDAIDILLTCDLRVNGVVEENDVLVTNATPNTESVSGVPLGISNWNVTCWDSQNNTNQSVVWEFNRTYPDFQVNTSGITFNNSEPTENETITINATITNPGIVDSSSIVVQFYNGDPSAGGVQIGSNQTVTVPAGGSNVSSVTWNVSIGTSEIFVLLDPFQPTNGSLQERNETNNNATKNLTVGGWHFFYGDVQSNSKFVLDDENDTSITQWNKSDLTNVNLYVTDYDASIDWLDLQALGKNTTDDNTTDDFAEVDSIFGMSSFTDSVADLYLNGSLVNRTGSFIIFSNTIDEVPLTHSINNSNFSTGILWDVSDDSNGTYDSAEKEDLVFITNVSQNTIGSLGLTDYELRVPARLREYSGPNLESAAFYFEIK